ncbi:hypothetical protein HHX47_DHR4001062 [Lentinula edodes]|nr:hypothetical protein HHX47_DHR4001062 [Lentinula edodes]
MHAIMPLHLHSPRLSITRALDSFNDRVFLHQSGNTIPIRISIITTPSHPSSRPSAIIGETPTWESCGRIISRERADFYEFIACNVLFVGAFVVLQIGKL